MTSTRMVVLCTLVGVIAGTTLAGCGKKNGTGGATGVKAIMMQHEAEGRRCVTEFQVETAEFERCVDALYTAVVSDAVAAGLTEGDVEAEWDLSVFEP